MVLEKEVRTLIKGLKIRLYPTKEQEKLMWQFAGAMRFMYNWTLQRQQENYENGGKFISSFSMQSELNPLKKIEEFSWLNNISSALLKRAVDDACGAYSNFFNGLTDFPKFKSRRKNPPKFYVRYDRLNVKENCVNFEKIGKIRIKPNSIPLNEKYCNPRCSYDGKYWYLGLGIGEDDESQIIEEVELNEDLSIGVDLGVKELAVLSTAQVYKNINKSKEMRKLYKKLRRLQRKVSRKYEMNKDGTKFIKTNNIIKLEKQIKLLHRRVANIRSNYNHHLTSDIVKQKPYRVVIEDLNVKGMMKNKHLAKAISKQGFYEIRRQIEYKCRWRGIEVIIADRWYPSSKTCSDCGSIKKNLKLSDRDYICTECGLVIDRDYNASLNLSKYTI